ncbi:HalOD1 output domain-containing protein [Haloplanus sp. GCM10025708]|uniref:HalOD1 output domain-containing protein n=1 Tax=Haloferacaceae TaxID=1644056 RepID=UPI00361B474B
MSSFEDEARARRDRGGQAGTVRRRERIEWTHREPVCLAIQTAVAAVEDADPIDLPPLAEYVDPDALDRLFERDAPGLDQRRIEFAYAGYRVLVDGRGEVVVADG